MQFGCKDLVPPVDGELEQLRFCEPTFAHQTTESSGRAVVGHLGRERGARSIPLLFFSGVAVLVQVQQPQLDC